MCCLPGSTGIELDKALAFLARLANEAFYGGSFRGHSRRRWRPRMQRLPNRDRYQEDNRPRAALRGTHLPSSARPTKNQAGRTGTIWNIFCSESTESWTFGLVGRVPATVLARLLPALGRFLFLAYHELPGLGYRERWGSILAVICNRPQDRNRGRQEVGLCSRKKKTA